MTDKPKIQKIQIANIFLGVNGEVNSINRQGALTIFIRFAGCDLLCYDGKCDTPYALSKDVGKNWSIDRVMEELQRYTPVKHVTITGGDPELQLDALTSLCRRLTLSDYYISLESNGSHCSFIRNSGPYMHIDSIIMDYKLPSTGVEHLMILNSFRQLGSSDWIKFVIADRADYERACYVIEDLKLPNNVVFTPGIAFSPKYNEIEPREIIEWMKEDKLTNVVIQSQMHKIWYPELVDNTDPKLEV